MNPTARFYAAALADDVAELRRAVAAGGLADVLERVVVASYTRGLAEAVRIDTGPALDEIRAAVDLLQRGLGR